VSRREREREDRTWLSGGLHKDAAKCDQNLSPRPPPESGEAHTQRTNQKQERENPRARITDCQRARGWAEGVQTRDQGLTSPGRRSGNEPETGGRRPCPPPLAPRSFRPPAPLSSFSVFVRLEFFGTLF
jgi:hypothetical protein